MKLLHIADLHLDRSFEGLKMIPAYATEQLQEVNKRVLHRLVDSALKNQVDAVIFSGDTFHQSRTSIQTQVCFFDALQRLLTEEVQVIMSFGNHDYYEPKRYWFDFPENVFLFEQEAVTTYRFVTRNKEKVTVSGFSYLNPWIQKSKLPEFPRRDEEADIHIGVYHGDLATDHTSRYAPFSLSEMKALGYDYWALGHIHKPEILSADPLIVYPGTPQGHSRKETGVQGAGIVNIGAGPATIRFEPVAQAYWQQTEYSLKECRTKQDALSFLEAALRIEAAETSVFCLKALVLKDTNHLDDGFVQACENGEVLAYLQAQLVGQQQKLIVFAVSIIGENGATKLPLRASHLLLQQLESNYLRPEIFAEEMKELLQHPQFSKIQPVDASWRKKCVQQADQYLNKYFTIQED